MVETWRCPKASYSVSSMACGKIPRRDAVSRSITKFGLQAAVLLVGGHVAQARTIAQLRPPVAAPRRQFLRVGVFHRVLILRAAHAVFHRQVLHRLHVKRDAVDLRQFRLQPRIISRGRRFALVARLQVDLNASAVRRCSWCRRLR